MILWFDVHAPGYEGAELLDTLALTELEAVLVLREHLLDGDDGHVAGVVACKIYSTSPWKSGNHTVKKGLGIFPSPAGMSQTKLS